MVLKLTRLREEDLETVMHWRMQPDVSRYMFTEPKLTIEIQKNWFQRIENDLSSKYWVIEFEGSKIGLLNLIDIDLINGRCLCGHYIADISMRGKGLGRLIEYNIYDYVLITMGMNKLCWKVLAFNDMAIALHQKCGSEIEGVLRHHIKKNDKYYDVVVMGILRERWLELRKLLDYPHIDIEDN